MKLSRLATAIVMVLLAATVLLAGEIYTWLGEDGTVMITDRPPPGDAPVRDVLRYREKTALEIQEEARAAEIKRQERLQEQATAATGTAGRDADAARQDAEEAVRRAQEAKKELDGNIEKYSHNKNKRKQFRSKIQRLSDEAQAAKARADAAVDRANQAAEAARKAKQNLQALESRPR